MFSVDELVHHDRPAISFKLESGELVCLSGPSGCGKTQLLRALVDLDLNQGTVMLQSQSRDSIPAPQWRSRVAMLPADSQWWAPTVGAHFLHPEQQNWKQLGFDSDVSDWRVERLSSGEKQRLALMRLLENEPQVLLLDEPTANLDAENIQRMEQLVKHYIEKHRACALWITHDRQQIARLQARELVMNSSGLSEVA